MKRTILALTLMLNASAASAEVLSTEETGFAVLATAGVMMATSCDATIAEGGMAKYVDRTGIDGDTLMKAVTAVFQVRSGQPYERADLVPAITQIVNSTTAEIGADLKKNKSATCSEWISNLRKLGVLK